MKNQQKEKRPFRKILKTVGNVTLAVAGFIVIPPLIDKYGSRLYKASLKHEKTDFDNMVPGTMVNENGEEVPEE